MIRPDKSWTLFLDRDGVINRKREGDYVRKWEQFEFLPGSVDAVVKLNGIFGRIIIVTNQQGIGKGIFTHEDLSSVHGKMCEAIELAGGSICKIYYAPFLASENHPDRKPGTGMGRRAKTDYPEIDFSRSVLVGDSETDLQFGKELGMYTIFISSSVQEHKLADKVFPSLAAFAAWLGEKY